MSKRGRFGIIIPKVSEIVKIDGKKVYDADGDEFLRSTVELQHMMGGEWQRVSFPKSRQRRAQKTHE